MKLRSYLIQQPAPENYLILDVIAPTGHFTCTLAIGRIENGEVLLSPVGQRAMEALSQHVEDSPNLTVHIIEITSQLKARQRVPAIFATAKAGSAMLFVCRDSHVYDAVFALLGFEEFEKPSDATH